MELFGFTSRGLFQRRSIFTFVLTVLMTALLWATFATTASNAQAPTEAPTTSGITWNGDSLSYNGRTYVAAPTAKTGDSHQLAEGTRYYLSIMNGDNSSSTRKAMVIYFAPGVDPPTATTANYVEYDYSSDDEFSNPRNRQAVTATARSASDTGTGCIVSGVGWLVCNFSTFLAESMDNLFTAVSNFVAVEPIPVTDTDTALYQTWNVMRTIANVAFILVFLIIIYSQVTGLGVTNYGLKKLIPRLFVAAILVNVSFLICSLAVDLSNIAGFSLQNIIIEIRKSTFGLTEQSWANNSLEGTGGWAQLTAAVLSGSAIAYVGISAATAASGGTTVFLLVPLLIGLALTILFVLLILAARQAIIIILIVIAPLAFVANLLPNTEKLFDKWKDLFISMLLFFPAFSLVFGGSQLAGGIIIQNANDILMVIFGMAVQVAPLIITPLILRLSSGVLGRIAGLLNDPRKGALDRTKNWANDRATRERTKSMRKSGAGFLGMRSTAKMLDRSNRYTKQATQAYEKDVESNALDRDYDKYQKLDEITYGAEKRTEANQNQIKADTLSRANTFGTDLHADTVRLDGSKIVLDEMTNQTNKDLAGYRAGLYDTRGDTRMEYLQQQMVEGVKRSSSLKLGETSNQNLQTAAFATDMQNRTDLQLMAEGYGDATQRQIGRTRAIANATATLEKISKESLENNKTLIRFDANRRGIKDIDVAKEFFANATSNNPTRRAKVNDDQIEAALEVFADDGQTLVFEQARRSVLIDKKIKDRVISRNAGMLKQKGGFHVQASTDLDIEVYLEKMRAGTLTQEIDGVTTTITTEDGAYKAFDRDMIRGRLKSLSSSNADALGTQKHGTFVDTSENLEKYVKTLDMKNTTKQARGDQKVFMDIHRVIRKALQDPNSLNSMNDREGEAREIDMIMSKIRGVDPIPRDEDDTITPDGLPNRPKTGADYPSTPNMPGGSPAEANNED